MNTINFNGDPTVNIGKYNAEKHEQMLRRRQQALIDFRKSKKYHS